MKKEAKKELTMLERFELHAASKSEAKRVYNLFSAHPGMMDMSMEKLCAIPGIGRKSMHLILEVVMDLAGKK